MIGATIGAVAALLTAPQTGKDTRDQIREKGIELREKSEATYADMQRRAEEAVGDLQRTVDRLLAKANEGVVELRKELATQTHDLADEVAPKEGPIVEAKGEGDVPS
jgi:gas vesicle protein